MLTKYTMWFPHKNLPEQVTPPKPPLTGKDPTTDRRQDHDKPYRTDPVPETAGDPIMVITVGGATVVTGSVLDVIEANSQASP